MEALCLLANKTKLLGSKCLTSQECEEDLKEFEDSYNLEFHI